LIAIIEMPIVQSGRRETNALEFLLLAACFVLFPERSCLQAGLFSDFAVNAYNGRIGTCFLLVQHFQANRPAGKNAALESL